MALVDIHISAKIRNVNGPDFFELERASAVALGEGLMEWNFGAMTGCLDACTFNEQTNPPKASIEDLITQAKKAMYGIVGLQRPGGIAHCTRSRV
ncbi:unnamed protein product [Haemonchus placei]|uniref:Amidohydrolase n=1 Tax=Haemonchus placei TaxID=6290 RepID=A0A0N4WSG3_HAEPC|nr:unnamed protein product [Haemonchus placei]